VTDAPTIKTSIMRCVSRNRKRKLDAICLLSDLPICQNLARRPHQHKDVVMVHVMMLSPNVKHATRWPVRI